MPRGKHRVRLVGGMVVVLMLSACASPSTVVRSSSAAPVATPSPAFTSNKDAFNAAVAFYNLYLTASNAALRDPNPSDSGLGEYLSAPELKSEVGVLARLKSDGNHLSGALVVRKTKQQSVNLVTGSVAMYVCLDATHARIINAEGSDITPSSRPNDGTLLIEISGLPKTPIINSSKTWSGSSIC